MSLVESKPISSILPINGEIYVAPASQAIKAWWTEKIKVTFVLIPSSVNALQALIPSIVIGNLITIFLWILANSKAWAIMSSALPSLTSAEIGPSTSEVISVITSFKALPSLAINEGLVVTPLTTPHEAASLISSKLAVSINNLIFNLLYFLNFWLYLSIV